MKQIIISVLMMLPCAVSGHSTESIPGMIHHSNDTSCGENSMTYPIVDAFMLEVVSSTQNDKAGEFWIFGKDTVRNVNNAIDRLIKENLVLDVCNVPFGSSYGEVQDTLKVRFGDSYKSSNDCIAYINKEYEGVFYTDINFLFQSEGEKSFLCRAMFSKDCKSLEEAVKLKKALDDKLSKQYRLYKVLDENNIYLSVGGVNPVVGEGGYAITIDILEYSQHIQETGIKCAVRITYGPFDYKCIQQRISK